MPSAGPPCPRWSPAARQEPPLGRRLLDRHLQPRGRDARSPAPSSRAKRCCSSCARPSRRAPPGAPERAARWHRAPASGCPETSALARKVLCAGRTCGWASAAPLPAYRPGQARRCASPPSLWPGPSPPEAWTAARSQPIPGQAKLPERRTHFLRPQLPQGRTHFPVPSGFPPVWRSGCGGALQLHPLPTSGPSSQRTLWRAASGRCHAPAPCEPQPGA
mmetsp:Transcript_106488/g.339162  ORF Transcript_106488/g.339162 Transcript_106488/m.339162 type:complete len:219 (-) Transcript_106488:208-864(-)